jgi:hypothetical protein
MRMMPKVFVAATAGTLFGLLSATPAGAAVAVQGTVAGAYRSTPTNPDTGHAYKLTAHGHTSLGSTTAKGTVRGPGNIASGHCTARLTLATSKGTIVVRLRSQKQVKAFASCRNGFAFNWHTAKATGGYEGASPSGTGTLTLVPRDHASHAPPPAYVTFDPDN